MNFRYRYMHEWPPLAWLARCCADSSEIEVHHGRRVEIQEEWFSEAIWAGEYESGDFDQTDIIFGSGCRIREEKAIFVSSGSTVDRLHSLQHNAYTLVSNSLICLMASVDAKIDPAYSGYFKDFGTIIRGLRNYKRILETSSGPV